MPTFNTIVSDFTGRYSSINGQHSLNLSKRKCLKFATTVGLSLLRTSYRNDPAAVALAAYRAMAIKCSLNFNSAWIRPQTGFKNLEATEKANISFWIGMTMAAVLADHFLSVPRLIHATQFSNGVIGRTNADSKQLADLIGIDSTGSFHVIEAKGRQRRPSPNIRNDWKVQASSISTVNGRHPATHSYSVAMIKNEFSTELVDPEPPYDENIDHVHLQISEDLFRNQYYKPLWKFLDSEYTQRIIRRHIECKVRVIAFDPIDGLYVYLGLHRDFINPEIQNNEYYRLEEYDDEELYIGSDGIVVYTSPNPCEHI